MGSPDEYRKRRSVKLRIWVQFNLEQRGYETALLPKYRAVYGQAISVLTAQHSRSKPGAPELHRSEPSFPGAYVCASGEGAWLFFFEQFYLGYSWYDEGDSDSTHGEPEDQSENNINSNTLSLRKAP